MPAILKENITKLNENLTQSFKKSEKENYENHPTPTVKQVLSAKIEYEEIPNYTNTLSSLQTKYIVLKPNQQPLNGKSTFFFLILFIPFFCNAKVDIFVSNGRILRTFLVKNISPFFVTMNATESSLLRISNFFIILFSQTFSLSF